VLYAAASRALFGVLDVLEKEKLFVKGDADELERLG